MNIPGIVSGLSVLLQTLPDEIRVPMMDQFLDNIEDAVAATETKVDDAIIGGACAFLRRQYNIPDNDPPAG